MKLPAFLQRFIARPAAENPGRALARIRHNKERNRIIDRANEMAAELGMPLIARRPE